jgi:UDPglucose 6-dehydrogenase
MSEPKIAHSRVTNVSIFGAGYVGLVTGCGLAKLGHRVTIFDTDSAKIAKLQNGLSPFYEPGLEDLLVEGISAGKLHFTRDSRAAIADHRYIFVAVPTPMLRTGGADLTHLHQAIADISDQAHAETLIIVKSTIPVGTFADLSRRLPTNSKIKLVSNPEFVAEGNAVQDFFRPFRTVIGAEEEHIAREVGGLFRGLPGKYIYTDPNTAQMIKYGSNALLATRVAFINELAQVCERLQVDITDVSRALLMDVRLGSGYLNAGIGFAGPCLPKDIAALQATATSVGLNVPLLAAVSEQNTSHLKMITQRIASKLNGGGIASVFGLSFKPNTDDVRNSFCISIVRELARSAETVKVTDPRSLERAKSLLPENNVSFFADPLECASGSDVQIFLTPWPGYKSLDLYQLKELVRRPSIFDAMQTVDFRAARALGFSYEGIGRHFADGPPPFQID